MQPKEEVRHKTGNDATTCSVKNPVVTRVEEWETGRRRRHRLHLSDKPDVEDPSERKEGADPTWGDKQD